MLQNRLAKLREARENGENGFTLIELLVVVVIIGILIAIAIPVYLNYERGAADKSAQSDLRGGISTLELCNSGNGSYPTVATINNAKTQYTLTGCTTQNINVSSGTTMIYTPNSTATTYTLVSTNSGGSGAIYCYNSANGGAVKNVSSTTVTSLAAATAAC